MTAEVSLARLPGQTAAVAQRSIRGMLRQPQTWASSMVFPLFFAALSAAAFDRTRNLPGFPEVSSFVAFLLAATVIQGVMFGASSAGNDVAIDIDTGFFDRLIASPMSRLAMILGRLAGTMTLGVVQALVFVVVLLPFGATMEGGIGAWVVTSLVAAIFAGAIGAFSMTVGIRTGSVEAVNGFFPIFFALVFLSSAFFPPEISGGWFETVANLNPLSVMVDSLRELQIVGWSWNAAWQALLVPTCLLALFLLTSLQALRSRLAQ